MLFDAKTQKWTELVKTKPNSGWEEWSRDGDYIYFLGAPPGGQQGVFRVRTSDRKLEQVASLKDFRQALGWGQWVGLPRTILPSSSATPAPGISTPSTGTRLDDEVLVLGVSGDSVAPSHNQSCRHNWSNLCTRL